MEKLKFDPYHLKKKSAIISERTAGRFTLERNW